MMDQNTPLPTPPEALMARLADMGIPYKLHTHEAVFTASEAGHLKTYIPGVHVKNLFLKDKKDRMALVVVPDEMQMDLKALAPAIGLDRISFGSPERLWQYLGVRPGSVCPFAVINDRAGDVPIFLHESVAKGPIVNAHPMLNTMTVEIASHDLLRFLEEVGHTPTILDLKPYSRKEAA